jgi:F-type H+-transporting ATPase subunit b
MEHPAVELSWSTFVLEIINFLVLLWILKHFLYKPVLGVIARRRAGIEKTLTDAEVLHADAEKLQKQYQGRLADWNQERQQARAALSQELETERARKMAELQITLEEKKKMASMAEARRQADAMRKFEETALKQGARFATRLLEQASGPETEARLVELVLTELSKLPDEHIAALRNSNGKTPAAVVVVSAFPLPGDQRQRLEQALSTLISPDISLRFEQDSDLLAGIRITIGAWVLGVNLRDELKGFIALAHVE